MFVLKNGSRRLFGITEERLGKNNALNFFTKELLVNKTYTFKTQLNVRNFMHAALNHSAYKADDILFVMNAFLTAEEIEPLLNIQQRKIDSIENFIRLTVAYLADTYAWV